MKLKISEPEREKSKNREIPVCILKNVGRAYRGWNLSRLREMRVRHFFKASSTINRKH